MSRSNLYVLLADGTVRYGLWNGTCDQAMPYLVDDLNMAWDVYYPENVADHQEWTAEYGAKVAEIHAGMWDHHDSGEGQRAVAYSESGHLWRTTATRTHITGLIAWDQFWDSDDFERLDADPWWATDPAPVVSAEHAREIVGGSS